MLDRKLENIDGRILYYAFLAGAQHVIANQSELNRINVFPVKDGDTGSNLVSTVETVIRSIRPVRSYKHAATAIADAAILGARGNSGIIFAQFLYGLSNETHDDEVVNLLQFSESLRRSVRYVYEAVANPVEGTMLTVISDWAEFFYTQHTAHSDFRQMLILSCEVLQRSLAETRQKLEVLRRANVVDAGAKGFTLFIEGIVNLVKNRNVRHILAEKIEVSLANDHTDSIQEEVTFRYCTEAVIRNNTMRKNDLSRLLSAYGDSAIVAGPDKLLHIHVHTSRPSDLFYELHHAGTLLHQKADDMVRQSEAAFHRKWNIALVTDSTCDLSRELLDHYQVNMLPVHISFGENTFLDKVTLQPEHFYRLLEELEWFPKTAQVNEATFRNLYTQLASHYDSVIAFHLTDKFSGTYRNSARAAKDVSQQFNKPITVINSRTLSGSLGLIVLRAAQAIASDMTHEQVVSQAENWIGLTKIFVSVRSLETMIRGGRVSYVKGTIARLFNINPIVSMDDQGKATVFGKTIGQKANMQKVIDHITEISQGRRIWNYIVLHARNEEGAGWYIKKMTELTGQNPVSVVNISSVIGAHAGAGAASVALMFEK